MFGANLLEIPVVFDLWFNTFLPQLQSLRSNRTPAHILVSHFRINFSLIFANMSSTQAPATEATAKTPVKKGRGRPKKAPETEVASPAEGAEGDATPAEPTTPKPTAKRGRPAKAKTPATPNEDGEAPATAPKSTTKRGAAKAADGETPSKKQKAAPKAPKAAAAPKAGFPTCWEEFSEEDKLIVTMRRDKAAWTDIEAALEKITGNKPGKDVTRKKYAKLEAIATIFAPGDVSVPLLPFPQARLLTIRSQSARLAAAKITVEGQITESIKQLNLTKWTKIAEEMKNNGAGVYKAAALEKKYDNMAKNGKTFFEVSRRKY